MSRSSVPSAGRRQGMAFLALLMLVAPLLLLLSSRSADAAHPVPPEEGRDGLHRRHHGQPRQPDRRASTSSSPSPTAPPRPQTTEEDGKFSFAGHRVRATTSSASTRTPCPRAPSSGRRRGEPPSAPTAPSRSTTSQLGQSYAATLTVRDRRASTTPPASSTRSSSPAFNGLRLGLLLALASVGLSLIYGTTGLSNFAHAEQVTLGGMVAYLLRQRAGCNALVGGVLVVIARVQRLVPGPRAVAAAATARAGADPADDRDHRPLAGRCSTRSSTSSARAPSASWSTTRRSATFGPIRITTQSLVAMVICDRGAGRRRLRAAAHPDRPRHPRGLRQPGARPGLRHRHRQGDPAGVDGRDGRSPVSPASSTRSSPTASSGTPGCRSCCCCSPRSPSVASGPRSAPWSARWSSGSIVEMSPLVIPGDFKYAAALLILILLLLVRPQGLLGKAQRVG